MKITIRPFGDEFSRQKMLPVRIDRDRMKQIMDSFQDGKAIEAPPGGWSWHDQLLLAGVCAATAMPGIEAAWAGLYGEEIGALHRERQEAWARNVDVNVHAAVELVSMLSHKITSGKYDQMFEPVVEGMIHVEDDTAIFQVTDGQKDNT